MDISVHKDAIRGAARAARQSLTEEERAVASAEIAAHVLGLPELAGCGSALVYAALPEEVDPAEVTAGLRAHGARVALPRVCGPGQLALHWVDEDEHLVHSEFGIPEPPEHCEWAAPDDLEAVLVPGVAFDLTCSRLGFGGGFYDVLLPTLPDRTVKIGIAFDEQIVDHIPAEAHDTPVDIVVTPTRVLRRSETLAL
jgi:5-formyltetrahydrofolate cyclo-ligase